jgi:hypothetical protein
MKPSGWGTWKERKSRREISTQHSTDHHDSDSRSALPCHTFFPQGEHISGSPSFMGMCDYEAADADASAPEPPASASSLGDFLHPGTCLSF